MKINKKRCFSMALCLFMAGFLNIAIAEETTLISYVKVNNEMTRIPSTEYINKILVEKSKVIEIEHNDYIVFLQDAEQKLRKLYGLSDKYKGDSDLRGYDFIEKEIFKLDNIEVFKAYIRETGYNPANLFWNNWGINDWFSAPEQTSNGIFMAIKYNAPKILDYLLSFPEMKKMINGIPYMHETDINIKRSQ